MNSTVTISVSALAALLGLLPSDPAVPPLVCQGCDHLARQATEVNGEGVERGWGPWGPPAWPDEAEASQADLDSDEESVPPSVPVAPTLVTPPFAAQVVAPAYITDSSSAAQASSTEASSTAVAPAGSTPPFARGLMNTRTNVAIDSLNLDTPPDNANTGTWYVITQGRWIGVHNNL